jgi:hypothetical protein
MITWQHEKKHYLFASVDIRSWFEAPYYYRPGKAFPSAMLWEKKNLKVKVLHKPQYDFIM